MLDEAQGVFPGEPDPLTLFGKWANTEIYIEADAAQVVSREAADARAMRSVYASDSRTDLEGWARGGKLPVALAAWTRLGELPPGEGKDVWQRERQVQESLFRTVESLPDATRRSKLHKYLIATATLRWYDMGERCRNGKGAERDVAAAAEWYCLAARIGHVKSVVSLWTLALDETSPDLVARVPAPDAIQWCEKAADGGDVGAMVLAARAYDQGRLTRADPERARRWFEKAADAGDAWSMLRVGALCEAAKDVEGAVAWYNRAKDRDPRALTRLGWMCANRQLAGLPPDEHRRMWEAAAAQKETGAMLALAEYWEQQRDLTRMVEQYRRAAELRCGEALFRLSQLYREGHGVPADDVEADRLLRQAAECGYPAAKSPTHS